jgi:hypothetical protein
MQSGTSILRPGLILLGRLISPFVIAFPFKILDARLGQLAGLIGLVLFGILVATVVTYPSFMKREGYYLAYFAGGLAYLLTPFNIEHIAFYEIAAQVAPVLFLALTIETRTFQPLDLDREVPSLSHWFSPVPIIALVYVEFESLRVIALNDPARGTFDVVVATLVAAGVSLFISAALIQLPHGESRPALPPKP